MDPQPEAAKDNPVASRNPVLGDLVQIEWYDAFGCPAGWEFADEASLAVSRVKSVGWIEFEDEHCIQLVPHIGQSGEGRRQFAGHLTIPVRQVVRLATLTEISSSGDPVAGSVPSRQGSSPASESSDCAASLMRSDQPASKSSRS